MAGPKMTYPFLAAESIDKAFGSHRVLAGLTLRIGAGEFVAMVGKSGCGKSTLLRLIAGLSAPDSGTIRIGSRPLKGLNASARVMFQEARVIPWKSIGANVALGLRGEGRRRAMDLLGSVGLAARAGEWPANLSGGQLQRVALARALASSPDLLLLDEPLGSLDAFTRIEMQDLIQSLWLQRRFAALLITHEVEEALVLADRVLVLEAGKITLEVAVELPRPRDRGTPEFAALKSRILGCIMGNPKDTIRPPAVGPTGEEPFPRKESEKWSYQHAI